MKKLSSLLLAVTLLAGCATQSHTIKSQDASGKPVVDKTVTKQSDNGAVAIVVSGIGFVRDGLNLILPPLVSLITKAITSTVVGSSNTSSNAP